MTPEVARAILGAVAGRPLEPSVRTALATGLRQGELLALRWRDLDLERGLVSVRGSLLRSARTVAPTKTEASQRTVRVDPDTVAMLRAHRTEQVRPMDDGRDRVFRTSDGQPLHARSLARDWRAAIVAAGLPAMPWHQLRHGFATLALEQGVDLAVVSKSLGHSALATTADVYSHLTPAMSERVAGVMGAVLGAVAPGAASGG